MADAEQNMNIITDADNEIWEAISGVGLVIDDDLIASDEQKEKEIKEINKIIDILESQNIPLITCNKIPNNDKLKKLRGVSFIILDWNLIGLGEEQKSEGIVGPQESSNDELNIEFLMKLKENFLLPVFILTNEEVDDIEEKLKKEKLIEENKPQFIFVKRKNALLKQDELKKCMIEWVKSSSPIYMLELLESKINSAKKDTFSMFYNMSPNWVNILYQQAVADKIDPVQDIFETIIRNIENRIVPLELDTTIQEKIKNDSDSITDDNTLKQEKFNVSSGRIMIKAEYIKKDIIDLDLGYLFYDEQKKEYLLNVTPTCSNINRGEKKPTYFIIKGLCVTDSDIDNQKKILIEQLNVGERTCLHNKISKETVVKSLLKNNQITKYYLTFISERDDIIRFKFKTLKSMEKKEMDDIVKNLKLVGKILPPFITDIQLHLSQYLIRQGLPRLPLP